jgi:hypothetical protein
MMTLSRFITKYTGLIVAVLSCFDRVIFKGHLALAAPSELERYVDCVLKGRRTEFMKTMAPLYSNRLVEHAQNWARKEGRTYEYRTGDFRKDQWAQKLIRDQGDAVALQPDRAKLAGRVVRLGSSAMRRERLDSAHVRGRLDSYR